ncbi:MAG: hypothetical protein ACK5RA_08510 [Cyanobacteriota bacterium]
MAQVVPMGKEEVARVQMALRGGAPTRLTQRGVGHCMCQSRKRPRSALFCGGDKTFVYFFAHPEMLPFHVLADRCKRLSPLLAAPAVWLSVQGQAKAVLTYNIFESAGAVIVQTSGSLDLTGATLLPSSNCDLDGAIFSPLAIICTGRDIGPIATYAISGPTSFDANAFLAGGPLCLE